MKIHDLSRMVKRYHSVEEWKQLKITSHFSLTDKFATIMAIKSYS